MTKNLVDDFSHQCPLRIVLGKWTAPVTPDRLHARIVSSFIQHFKFPRGPLKNLTEVYMKGCKACGEEFDDKFSFCPVDATPLNELAAALMAHAVVVPFREFRLTIIETTSLLARLSHEVESLLKSAKDVWPDLKRDPIGMCKTKSIAGLKRLMRNFLTANTVAPTAAAILIVVTLAFALIIFSSTRTEAVIVRAKPSEDVLTIRFPEELATNDGGIGMGRKGRVGFGDGQGEGSDPVPRRSGGGGGGGERAVLATQQGKVPYPSNIPAPIPVLPPAQKPSFPVAGVDLDPVLWKDLPMARHGDPRSSSQALSNGPGDGGGMGSNNGQGVGEGSGRGFGPGEDGGIGGGPKSPGGGREGGGDGNDPFGPDYVHPNRQITERVRILAKPEPQYTESARKNGTTGTVVLRVVFSRTGDVTNIRTIQGLPFGLTERAIIAARQIRFRPATLNGRPVNVFMQLEYNFNLY
jgi:TonB family protein